MAWHFLFFPIHAGDIGLAMFVCVPLHHVILILFYVNRFHVQIVEASDGDEVAQLILAVGIRLLFMK